MKKTFKFFAAAIAIVVAASCTKELNNTVENLVPVTFSVALEDSKAYLDDNQVVWESTDSIAVWDGTAKRVFKISSISGSSAQFYGEVEAGATDFFVVSPYTSFVSVTGDSLAFTIPASQVVGSNSSAKDVLVSTARTSDLSQGVQLKNAVSLVKFSFKTAGATSVVLTGKASEKFVGAVSTKDGGETVVCAKGSTKLTVVPESGTFAAGTYYAAIAPSAFATGLNAFYGNATEKGRIATENEVVFERNGGINLKDLDDNTKAMKVPATITTTDELLAFGEIMPYYVAGETVKLGNDISLEGQTWNGGTFYGTLDGQGNTINHINITTAGDAAFINNLYGTVKDIKFGAPGDGSLIKCAATKASTYYIATIGKVLTGGQLTNVENYVDVQVDTIGYYVSGLCSSYSSVKTMSGCKNHGNVTHYGPSTSTINLAGLIGSIGAATIIENCENDGAVTYAGTKPSSTVNHGGIAGYTSQAATFKNCKNSGVVKVSSTVTTMGGGVYRLGGILGLNQGTGVTMEDCENSGTVLCEASGFSKKALYMGGLIGQNESKSTTGITLKNCTNSGELTSTIAGNAGITAIGGMVGYRAMASSGGALGIAKLEACVNIGNILDNGKRSATGTISYLGGMMGYNLMGATLTDCVNGMEGEEFGSVTKNTPASAAANVCKFGVVGGMIGWQGAPTTSAYSTSNVSLTGCHNYAAITNLNDGGSTYVYLGSMIAGNEPTTVDKVEKYYSVTIDNCVNDGAITNFSTGVDQVRMGGFIGDGANNFTLKNSTNNGEVSSSCAVTKTTIQYRVGGFVGSVTKGTNGKHLFTDLENKGNVSAENTSATITPAEICVGGIQGFMGKTSSKFTRCKSNAAIAASGLATNTFVKAIVGNTTQACTITDCALAGSCNGEAITAENFSGFVWGTDLATAPTVTETGTTFITE